MTKVSGPKILKTDVTFRSLSGVGLSWIGHVQLFAVQLNGRSNFSSKTPTSVVKDRRAALQPSSRVESCLAVSGDPKTGDFPPKPCYSSGSSKCHIERVRVLKKVTPVDFRLDIVTRDKQMYWCWDDGEITNPRDRYPQKDDASPVAAILNYNLCDFYSWRRKAQRKGCPKSGRMKKHLLRKSRYLRCCSFIRSAIAARSERNTYAPYRICLHA